jgi:tetratricopeptide (TPR) repeat protein
MQERVFMALRWAVGVLMGSVAALSLADAPPFPVWVDQEAELFALSLRDPNSAEESRAIDLGIVLDFSASQREPMRRASLALVTELVALLEGGSRVQIWLTHREGLAVLERPSAVGSDRLSTALTSLEESGPLGATDVRGTIEAIATWLEDRSGSLPKRILVLGDGRHTDPRRQAGRWVELVDRCRASRSAVFATEEAGGDLAALVGGTGGVRLLLSNSVPASLRALAQPVVLIDKLVIQQAGPTRLTDGPKSCRGDRSTLIVGRGRLDSDARIEVIGHRDGEPTRFEATLSSERQDAPTGLRWLADRFDLAMAVLEPTDLLRWASDRSGRDVETWVAQGRAALAQSRSEDAGRFFDAALTIEPGHLEATAGREVAGSAARAKADVSAVGEDDSIEKARARAQILKQKAVQDVTQVLTEARRLAKTDRDSTVLRLKGMLQTIDASELDADTKSKLRSRIESQLRQEWREQMRTDRDRVERGLIEAHRSARAALDRGSWDEQSRQRQRLNAYRSLLAAGMASSSAAVAEQARSADPGSVAASGAVQQAQVVDRYVQIEDLEWAKQRGWWNTLQSADQSSIPFSDAVAITFPSAGEWEALSKRREKYKTFDISPVSPAESAIRSVLAKPVSFDFKETPLSDVVRFVRDLTGVNVVLDAVALDAAGVDPEEPVTLALTDVPLKSALKLILGPLDLSYLVRDDVLFLTSREEAESLLETKVYYVADLVIPIQDFNGGGAGLNGQVGGGNQQGGQGQGLPGGGGGGGGLGAGGGFRRDLSDELKRIIQGIEGDQSSTSQQRRDRWSAVLASGELAPSALPVVLMAHAEAGRHRDSVELLSAAVDRPSAPSWLAGALVLAMSLFGSDAKDIEQTALSIVDREPTRLSAWLEASRLLGRVELFAPALAICRNAADRWGPSINMYLLALALAEEARDADAFLWALSEILGRDWPERDVVSQAKQSARRFEVSLRQAGESALAERVRTLAESDQQRDLQIVVRWEGDADVDLSVVEPTGVYCSAVTPRTLGGGVLTADGATREETYSAAIGWSGDYEIRLTPVWGEPIGGIVNVDVVMHQGTDREKRERRTVRWPMEGERLTVSLEDGRRSAPEALSPDARRVVGRVDAPAEDPRAALRRWVQGGAGTGSEPAAQLVVGRQVPFVTGGGAVASGGAVAFDPVVTAIPDGVQLFAQAVVSADRRFVRLQMAPLLQSIEAIQDVREIQVGGAVRGPVVIPPGNGRIR